MKKLLLITDAWQPQTNGVVTTYKNTIEQISKKEVVTEVIHPGLFKTIPCPGYAEIRLVLNFWKLRGFIRKAKPDYIHVSVEGPLGYAAKFYCDKRNIPYSTAFHTRFPEYVNERLPFVSVKWIYAIMRWFHKKSRNVLVTTKTMEQDLARYGIKNMVVWGRGVDTDLYKPLADKTQNNVDKPIWLYVGRVAVEKNLKAFLELDLPGKKIIVGDGPDRNTYERQHPAVEFVGFKYGKALAEYYAKADVFVFPSKTDTFGLVMLEALACGTPVAAYPVPGPVDVIQQGLTGSMQDDLLTACHEALKLKREDCRNYALTTNWASCAQRALDAFVQISDAQKAQLN